jgi:hypothetical protein
VRTRAEHLEWCKQQALEYVDAGEVSNAVASMGSDLEKHPETTGHSGMQIGMGLLMAGLMSDPEECRGWIEGFH